jgi:hypothetical protein
MEKLMNNVLERIWKEAVVTQFDAISWNISGGTKGNYDTLLSV